MARKKRGIPGLSFSWKRASGLSSAKAKLSRQIGVPLTRSGRQQKIGKATGCPIPFGFILAGLGTFVAGAGKLAFCFGLKSAKRLSSRASSR
jgi:hypothetical protein